MQQRIHGGISTSKNNSMSAVSSLSFEPQANFNPRSRVGTQDATVSVGLARTAQEIHHAQRLRYDVFVKEFDSGVSPVEQKDEDRYDRFCDHLVARCNQSGRVVGTYRILTPERAQLAGSYYCETNFDFSGLSRIRKDLVEFGRACVHPDYRNGAVIMMLWSGLMRFLQTRRYKYVFGCAGVSMAYGGAAAAAMIQGVRKLGLDDTFKVTPYHPLRLSSSFTQSSCLLPSTLKSYLKIGAKVCGEAAHIGDVNAAAYPLLLDVARMNERYVRHFGRRTAVPCEA